MKRKISMLLAVVMLASVAANAQQFWDKKPWNQWSEKDAKRILEDSPWTDKYVITEVVIQQSSRDVAGTQDRGNTEVWYTTQLRSAQPVRQALVRLRQIQSKYDSMSPEAKKNFDDQAAGFLNQQYPDQIVVHVSYGSNINAYDRQLSKFWGEQTLDKLRLNTFLVTGSGKRIAPANFQTNAQNREFYLIFPRNSESGEGLILRDEKKLSLELPHPAGVGRSGGSGSTTEGPAGGGPKPSSMTTTAVERIFLQFKPEKMVYGGSFIY